MRTVKDSLKTVANELESKEEYSYFLIHQVRYEFILERIAAISHGKKLTILDIGCFPYHIGKALELMGHTVYGIASHHEPVKNKKVTVLNIEKDYFPYQDNFFDVVLCNEVIEHLPQSPVFALEQMNKVTKKGGYCMVTTPNIARSINRVKLLLGKSIMYPLPVYFENGGKGNTIYHRHNREYTLSELEYLFISTSWTVVLKGFFVSYTPFRKRLVPDSPLLSFGKFLNYFAMICISFLKDTLYIVGQKS